MNLFFHPQTSTRFSSACGHAILSQILRDPLPTMPIILDFTYLSMQDNTASYRCNSFSQLQSESDRLASSPQSKVNNLHAIQTEQTQKPLEDPVAHSESNSAFSDYSAEHFLNALFHISKNVDLEPASEFDNWFPMYADLPMYE